MRKELPFTPPVLKSQETLRQMCLDLDDAYFLAIMVSEHLRLLNDARKDFVGCEGMLVALDELAANLDNVRSTLCPKEVE